MLAVPPLIRTVAAYATGVPPIKPTATTNIAATAAVSSIHARAWISRRNTPNIDVGQDKPPGTTSASNVLPVSLAFASSAWISARVRLAAARGTCTSGNCFRKRSSQSFSVRNLLIHSPHIV
jgi:hypothetical protein